MRVCFVVEKGNKGDDNVEVDVHGIKNLPKFIIITAEDYSTAIATGKVYVEQNELKVEADLREQEFDLYPTIGFESIIEENVDDTIIIKELELLTISLQPTPNTDVQIGTIQQQLDEGSARLI